ncbi:hypothetical protein EW146_g6842 [Bondarzewia mesenterica]|uniref:FAS1 domain-containing protein n=1 Tax=Bondarzewia mesenterica TaxID=1095465 RepID=A0A4V3XEE8_9AGAM|nr:hypothetical protein EW146_g6842 [Bondarzewia mesenterica]
MRLWTAIPLSLCALLPSSAFASSINAQVSLQSPPTASSTTLVDALSADPDYTLLIRLLKRSKLIPTLNKLNGSTFFAPTNDAIKRHSSSNSLWHTSLHRDPSLLADNLNEKLRQDLFYHLLNYTITLPTEEDVLVLKTLHFPRSPLDPPTHDPPPFPPWMPIPGGTLGGEPQRLRLAAHGGEIRVGVDSFGNGGVKLVKGQVDAGNGVLLGIDDVLPIPSNLGRFFIANVVAHHPSVSYFHKILTPEILDVLNTSSELTLFLPEDPAWDALHHIERLYLESEFAAADLRRIFEMHAVERKRVKWSDSFDPATNLTTVDGQVLNIVTSPDKVLVSDAELRQRDIYASNGVLHTVSSLLIPPGTLQLTPEKFLLTLNCTHFISLIHSVNLTHLVNDTETKYTILAPKDDVISLYGDDDLPEKGSEELKQLLKYHFLPGQWRPSKLRDGMLLETELDEPGLDGGRQVLEVEVSRSGKRNAESSSSIRFGGASIVGDPLEINNTFIYFVSQPLVPPADSLQVALPFLDLSSFLAAIFSASLADLLKTTPRTTLLIPRNSAFKRLGLLVSEHLLSATSKSDLEHVILHHALDDVVYAQSLQNSSSRTYATLEGSDIHVERTTNGSVLINSSGGWAGLNSDLYPKNMLSKTGVVHELSDVLIPRSLELTVGKLVKAAKGTTMASLVVKAGMDWVLNGTAPPEDSPWGREGHVGTGWTLLCPTDDAFKPFNLTQLYSDVRVLRAIVSQHLIKSPKAVAVSDAPNNNRPLVLGNSASYATLLSPLSEYGDIVFREIEGKELVVGIKDARGTNAQADWARVLSWGRATTGSGSGGVIRIDRLLLPYQPPWWIAYGAPAAVGVVGVLVICIFFLGVRVLWRRDTTEATYEPVGGFSRAEDALVDASAKINHAPCPPVRDRHRTAGLTGSPQITSAAVPSPPILESLSTSKAHAVKCTDADAALETRSASSTAADNVKSFIAGGFGGVAAVLVGHPFDLTKTRLQTAPPGAYKGALDVVRKTVAKDGITGMYRGMVPPLLGVTPIFAVSFWAYDASKALIYALTPNRTQSSLSTTELAAAGFLSAVPTTGITAPVERAKVLLQVQGQAGSDHKYKGVFDVMKHLYKEGGMRSIFRGSGATLARDGPGSAAYFAAYEVTKKFLTPAGSSPADLNLGAVIVAGGMAGVAMWAIAIPPDVLKSRLQSAPTGTYSGFFDCARKTIAVDGVGALWKGFGPAMGRAFPANAATFWQLSKDAPTSSVASSSRRTPQTSTQTREGSSSALSFLSERELERARLEGQKCLGGDTQREGDGANSSGSIKAEKAVEDDVFWDGEVRQTANKHVEKEKNGEDGKPVWRLSEIIGDKSQLSLAIISTYALDVQWIYQFFDPSTPVVLVTDSDGPPTEKKILPNWIRVTPFLPNGRGLMHMKFFLLFYKSGRLRIGISTANLIDFDWSDVENTVWVQDVPRRPSPIPHDPKASDFPAVFEDILRALNVSPALISSVHNDVRFPTCLFKDNLYVNFLPIDFFLASTHMLASNNPSGVNTSCIAGKHEGWPNVVKTGHMALMKSVREIGADACRTRRVVIEYQGSSIGNYTTQWLNEFYGSASGESPEEWLGKPTSRRTKLPWPPINILFPTAEWMIIATFEESGASGEASNSDTETKSGDEIEVVDGKGKEKKRVLGWMYTGSHNFSASAWGTLSGSGSTPVLYVRLVAPRASRIMSSSLNNTTQVKNYELGIVLPLHSESEIDWMSCFERPPKNYSSQELPWMVDKYVEKLVQDSKKSVADQAPIRLRLEGGKLLERIAAFVRSLKF